jgi:hypothetical protein
MGRIDAVISDELERKLRMKAVSEFGGKKGSLTEALEAAIAAWTKTESDEATRGKKKQ